LPRLLAQLEPDLCHIDEEPYNLATYLALRAARRVGPSTVCFAWQNLNRRYPPPFRWIEQYVYARVDGAIAGNHAAGQVSRDKGYRGPLAVIPQFGVDPDLFLPPASTRPADRPFTIGYAGRLVEEKGLLVLVEALSRLPGAWHMRFFGDGPLGPELKARLAAMGLADQVSWVPRIPSQEMPGVLATLDVVVLPSLTRPNWMEQFGRILIEAMSCGTPVVGSDSGEIPHVIGDGGLVVPENDPQALAEALARLRDDPALRHTLGLRGRARVLAHYTQAQIARDTCAFYRQIAG
jgi:glycosyltransferase involved in cell wall biosynthesis